MIAEHCRNATFAEAYIKAVDLPIPSAVVGPKEGSQGAGRKVAKWTTRKRGSRKNAEVSRDTCPAGRKL